MIRIHAIRTGSVRLRPSQVRRRAGGLLRVLSDDEWTPWLPILAWVIEHPEGVIVVDAGESARACEPGYFPSWHPYFRRAVEFDIAPEQEMGPQLAGLGVSAGDVRAVVLTHMHTDHTGGLSYFAGARVLVARPAYTVAVGPTGRLLGYQPEHWPAWFYPEFVAMDNGPVGPFPSSMNLTRDGAVVAVPTPGHTPGHLSVLVRDGEVCFLLAGDTSYSDVTLLSGTPDGLTLQPGTVRRTQARIRDLADTESLVYLPTHDPDAERRLREREVTTASRASA